MLSISLSAALLQAGCGGDEGGHPAAAAGSNAGQTNTSGGAVSGGTGNATSGATATGGSAGSTAGGAPGAGGPGAAGAGGEEPTCTVEPIPMPTGQTIELTPPMTLGDALAGALAGDRIVLHPGAWESETISELTFADYVFVEGAEGEDVSLPGAVFQSCDHIALSGLHFTGTLELDGSSDFRLTELVLDGPGEEAALMFQGQHQAGAAHDVLVQDSTIQGGGRTIFVLGSFAPSEQWNHHLTFVQNQVSCGSHVCFQISGGRDLLIEDNEIIGTGTSGVLTAGATAVTIARNRFSGMDAAAMQIATPGAEWDNYAGVENMISSAVVIANNVVDGWGSAVQLDAATDVAIVYNTMADGTGIRFNHRTPHDQQDNVILDGNSEIRVWNNILPSISLDPAETGPSFLSNNQIWEGGGAGDNSITDAPVFEAGSDYELGAGSPALGSALLNAETPLVDFDNRPRGDDPDLGARELGAPEPVCP